ncbi:MAG: RagB/SusD family nutrient uptake outer membrane protein, partial [Salinivirgaceae bacterium]|nr:RagB/SusD family nutrient uptake outer membrane protein [Salinivirgaceae bacterium]
MQPFNKKKMKNLLYIFSTIALIGFGCTNLDETLYEQIPGDQYPENEAQVATLSVDAYAQLKPFADDEGWWFLAQEVSSDELVFPTRDADWDDGGKWRVMHQHTWSNDVEGVNRMWSSMWGGITVCNQIIDRIKSLPTSEALENKIKEVETVRAFYYYLLIDNYGDTPYLTSALDVPLQPFKLSRAAIFDSLTYSLENNLPALKAIDNKYMATRYMAFAVLSKLYLNAVIYTGTPQWEKANQYTDSVLDGPYNLETSVTAPFITDNSGSSEIIFSIPYDEDNFQGFRIHMRTLHYQSNLTYDMSVGPWNGGSAVYDFFNTYEETDLRKQAWFIYGPQYDIQGNPIIESVTEEPLVLDPVIPAVRMDATYTPKQIRCSGARIGKYEIKKGAKENLSNDFPLFRLSDFYLMKAELEVRLGRNGDEWINPIRTRAGVTPFSNATLVDILAERGRELWVEGHRRQDLVRFGKFTNAWWGKGDSQGGKAGDPAVNIFPIPKWATDANPNLLLDPQ